MLRRARRIVGNTIKEFSDDRCATMAAALAYYSLFAMPAILLLAVYAAGVIFGREAAVGRVQAQLSNLLGPQAASAIRTMIAGAAKGSQGGVLAGVFAFGGLGFSALTAVYELQLSLNRAWDVELSELRARSFILKRAGSFLLIAGLTVLPVISLAAVPALSAFRNTLFQTSKALLYAGEAVVSWAIFTLLVAAILKVLPDAEIDWRDVWVGAALTSGLIVIAKVFIGLYLAHAGFTAYGAVGSIAVLLLWAYYCAVMLLLGFEFTQIWARERGQEVRPEKGAINVGRKERTPPPGHSSE
jgi:membrane protein